MKKFVLTLFIILTVFSIIYSDSIYPVDSELGMLADSKNSKTNSFLFEALNTTFSFDWCEKFLNEKTKKQITVMFSETLSSNLGNPFVMSKNRKINENLDSVVVRFLNSNIILNFFINTSPYSIKVIGENKSQK